MTITIVGGETLLGRDLRERLSERKVRGAVEMVAAEEQISVLTEAEDEPVVAAAMSAAQLLDSDIIFCAGSRDSSRKAYELGAKGGGAFVDLTYALEDEPDARLISPALRTGRSANGQSTIQIVAHPAATALALLLQHLQAVAPLTHSVVNVFEPASERGQAGIHELQQQTTSLLSFRSLEKRVFDAQLAFNMLAKLGEEAPEPLEEVEERLERHIATLLAGVSGNAGLPSLRLTQAPVFHGYSFSIWAQFASRPDSADIERQFTAAGLDVRGSGLEPPNNVGTAGQSGVAVGAIEADRNHPAAIWLWAVADNFRIAVDSAIDAAISHSEQG